MLKSVIFPTTSDSLKEKRDNPPATEDLIVARELKIELEDPHLVNMVQHHPYGMMAIDITLGDQLTKCAGNQANNRERKELEKGSGKRGIFCCISLSLALSALSLKDQLRGPYCVNLSLISMGTST